MPFCTERHDFAGTLDKGSDFRKRGRLSLKGFDEPVHIFEVVWQPAPSVETAVAGESRGRKPG